MGRRGGGGNAWNDFQRAHGGQGLSRGEMSAMYHASASTSVSTGDTARAPSAWNAFQHDYGGRGLSKQDMKSLYAHQKGEAPAPVAVAGPTKTWNEFQHEYAGTGLSRQQVAHLYYEQKPQETATAAPPPPQPAQAKHDPNRGFYAPFMFPAPSQTPQAPPPPQPRASPFPTGFSFGVPAHDPRQSVSPFGVGFRNETQKPPQQYTSGFSFGLPAKTPSADTTQQSPFGLHAWGFAAPSTAQAAGGLGVATTTTAAPSNAAFRVEEPQEIPVYLPFSVDSQGRDRSPEELALKYYRRRHAKNKSVASAKAIFASAYSSNQAQQSPKDATAAGQSGGAEAKQNLSPREPAPVRIPVAAEAKQKLMLSTVKEEDENENGESHDESRTENEQTAKAKESTTTPQEVQEKGVTVGSEPQEDVKGESQATAEPQVQQKSQVKEKPQVEDESQVKDSLQAKAEPPVAPDFKEVDSKPQQTASPDATSTQVFVLIDVNQNRLGNGVTGPTVTASIDGASTGQVAVKLLPSLKGKKALARHAKETATLLKLPAHPNVIKYHSFASLDAGKKVGVVTELVPDSQNLGTRLYATTSASIGEKAKHQLILQLLDALNHLHSHNITHRDLNPTHVLVSGDQNDSLKLKLIDFGLPTLKNAAAVASKQAGVTGFNAAYASPELLGGQISNEDVDAWKKSDIFSCAVVMMEILLEDQPWEGELPVFFMKAVAERGERPFDTDELRLRGRKSRVLEQIAAQAWHQDPDKRPTASVLREMLARVFGVEDQNESKPTSPTSPSKNQSLD